MNQCPQCGLRFSEGDVCPNCGFRIQRGSLTGGSGDQVRDFFLTVRSIMLTPTRFFREMPLQGGMAKPLSFALITHWVGSVFAYLWALLAGASLQKWASHIQFSGSGTDIDSAARMSRWFQLQQQTAHWFWAWFWGAGSIILDPFRTLIQVFFTAAFVYVAARLFVNSKRQTEISYESAVRLVAYGTTPAIIAALPFVGTFASAIYVMVVTIIGAREAFRVSNSRAGLIVLFPYLLFIGIIGLGIMALAFVALKFAISVI